MTEPTAREVLMLELVNRARRDPAAEAARLGIDLNEGLAPGTLAPDPQPPLAMNGLLIDSSRAHSQWMLDNDIFAHTGENGSSSRERMEAAGYELTGRWTTGENIAWQGTTGTPDLDGYVIRQHEGLFISPGHRTNILNADFREVGIGVLSGSFTRDGTDFNSSMMTQNFAASGSLYFITGVVYGDSDGNDFYSIGEGEAGVTVTASGAAGTFTMDTTAAGNFQLAVPPGSYDVTIIGGVLEQAVLTQVSVADENIRVAFETLDQVLDAPNAPPPSDGGNDDDDDDHGDGGDDAGNEPPGDPQGQDIGGTAGNDELVGTALGETIHGLGGDDVILAGAGNDRIFGGDGNDAITGGTGSDVIDGGAGLDTAHFLAPATEYQITRQGDSFTLVHLGETEEVSGVERLAFSDQTVAFDDDAASILRLYQAALGRAPDPTGMGFWLGQSDQGLSLRGMATQFLDSEEFVSRFGDSLPNPDFVDRLYLNVLGRTPDGGGRSFWVDTLGSGATREEVLLGFTDSPENVAITASAVDGGIWFV